MMDYSDWRPVASDTIDMLIFNNHVTFWDDDSNVEVASANRVIQLERNDWCGGSTGLEVEESADGIFRMRGIRAEDVLDHLAHAARARPGIRDRMINFVGSLVDPVTALRFAASIG